MTHSHPTAPALLSVEACQRALSIGRTATYQLLQSGQLRSIKIGKRRLVPAEALAEFVQSLQSIAA